ncbi:DUF2252 family protein [Peredibacter sp. HCB2-198]|uniref:DUF2252 family protein n=1 Tax=Peredibacter sp. HCB2-198 TaxID=3383025 RepID=UPI0038B647A4
MDEYLRRSHVFQKRLGNEPLSRREARYLLFRIACPLMQGKLPRFLDLSKVPTTFIHGNPHVDNYVRTFKGSAMLDFDRSRMGPYCWDIIRFLSALSLRREEMDGFLDHKVVEYFIDAYITHFVHPDIPHKQLKMLKGIEPDKWQMTTKEYLRSNKRWAKKMRESAISPRNDQVMNLLHTFLDSRNDSSLMNEYYISEVGLTPGSLGKKHYIYSLMPKNPDSHLDAIMLDIKEVYQEKNNKFFYSPVSHHGLRMIEASKIFADGMEERLGYCTYQNKQFWGRQVPSFAVKVKKFLDKEELCDFAYSVGSELGKGHRKGLKDPKMAELIEKDFQANFDKYYKISKLFTYELSIAFDTMMRKIKLYQDYRSW